MGWLRDLMRAARPPVKSFDDLARQCLKHANWPAEFQMQTRSFGALLGKLDRELELEWLTHRPAAQVTLCAVLGTTRDELLLALQPSLTAAPGRYLRLDDLPSGRLLDLAEETLFPGLPEELFRPADWDALWWQAPSGSGRSLVASWLRARGLLAPSSDHSKRGPEYIELDQATEMPAPRAGLCVASPLPPPAGFRLIRSAPVGDSLAALLEWSAERLPEAAHFDRRAIITWLTRGPLAATLDSAGAVIGLCGLYAEYGGAELTRRSPRQLMTWYLRRRATETLDPEAPVTQWVKRAAGDAIIAMLRQGLAESDEPWWCARSLPAWSSLLPSELRRETDVEWLSLSLARAGSGVRARDLERAARELPPGAYRLLRSFERMGVLRRSAGEELVLRPHWLASVAAGEAFAELAQGSPAEWGEALLKPHAASRVARSIWRRAESGDPSLAEELLEVEPGDDPALAAATELGFRVVGLAALRGHELPAEAAAALWNQALELSVGAPGELTRPRIEYPNCETGLLSLGSYYLAAWALSEELGPGVGRAHATLRPWSARGLQQHASELFGLVQAALEQAPELSLAAPAALLVARLARPSPALHALELPGEVITAAEQGKWSSELWQRLCASPFSVRALAEIVRAEPERAQALARALWTSEAPLLEGELGTLLFRHAPATAIERLLSERPQAIPYSALTPEQWARVSVILTRARVSAEAPELWRSLPESHLQELLASAVFPRQQECVAELWKRAPDLVQRTLDAAFSGPAMNSTNVEYLSLLAGAPAAQSAQLADKLTTDAALLALSTLRLRELQRWLHGRVASRAPGWRDTYRALARLERRLASVSRL